MAMDTTGESAALMLMPSPDMATTAADTADTDTVDTTGESAVLMLSPPLMPSPPLLLRPMPSQDTATTVMVDTTVTDTATATHTPATDTPTTTESAALMPSPDMAMADTVDTDTAATATAAATATVTATATTVKPQLTTFRCNSGTSVQLFTQSVLPTQGCVSFKTNSNAKTTPQRILICNLSHFFSRKYIIISKTKKKKKKKVLCFETSP